jgi:exodeoxyribonuclease V beta subunit
VLIGDPKQAIYSFRGADVRAYLDATQRADRKLDLATNYRSDGPLLGALDRLLAGTTFGDDDITFVPVRPADHHRDGTLVDDHDGAALQLRTYAPPHGSGNAPAIRQRFGEDVVAVLLDQLDRVHIGGRPLRPQDVAVLVRSNAEARLVQQCLREARIPSVVNGVGSVLATAAADDWRWLLEAVERSSDPGRIRRLALSCWIGWDAARLGSASDDDLDELHEAAHRWAHVLADHGVATLERTVLAERRVAARLLRTIGGERHLTDVRHLGELLHTAEREDDRGISSLRAWLQTAKAEAGDTPTPSEEQARRLESDAAAVQILTIHRAKGLQYPVVLAPFLWGTPQGVSAPAVVHDPDTRRRVVDVGPSERPGFEDAKALAQRESIGEQLRLLYVALTRAQHRAVVWWCRTDRSTSSALARVLFGRDDAGRVVLDARPEVPKGAADAEALLRTRFEGTATSLAQVPPPGAAPPGSWSGRGPAAEALDAARIDRTLDRDWRRTSYSAIVRRAAHLEEVDTAPVAPVVTEPEVETTDDEPDTPEDTAALDGAAADVGASGSAGGAPLPLGELRGGTAFGTLVHAVLEHTDFAAPDLPAHLEVVIADERPRHRVPGLTAAEVPTLVDGLVAAVRSPLGPLAGRTGDRWRALADVTRADRLDELEFELPLAGGDLGRRGGDAVALSALAELLDASAADGGLPDDDPLRSAGYADRLRAPGYALDLRGYLNGSIDLVLRVRDDAGRPRYLVADHKTNRLGGGDATTDAYHPERLTAAMIDHDYPLQALLYQVALHRFLRWRQPDYDPTVHLGGVLYLFLRGMVGPDTPLADGAPHGVFAWSPPPAVVTGLSDLLDGVRDVGSRAVEVAG